MAPPLLIPDPENATIEELKQVSPVGSNETAPRCTAIQMLLAGVSKELVRDALLVTNRALRKWINRFNPCGVDGLIVKKRPGRMTIMAQTQNHQLAQLATDVFAALLARSQPHRAHLANDESTRVQQLRL